MLNQAPKKKSKSPSELIADSRKKGAFMSLKADGKRTPALITGARTMWGTGQKARPNFVYLPGLAIAGDLPEVQRYVQTQVPVELQPYVLNGIISRTNFNSEEVKPVAWLFPLTDTDPRNAQKANSDPTFAQNQRTNGYAYDYFQASPRQLYEYEVARHSQLNPKSQSRTEAVPSLDELLNLVNSYLSDFGLGTEKVNLGEAAESKKATKGGSVAQIFTERYNRAKTTHVAGGALLITRNKNSVAPYVKIVKNVPADGVRIDPTPNQQLNSVYFKLDSLGAVPPYVGEYLQALTGNGQAFMNSINQRLADERARKGIGAGVMPIAGMGAAAFPQPFVGGSAFPAAAPQFGTNLPPLVSQVPQMGLPQTQLPGMGLPQTQLPGMGLPQTQLPGMGLPQTQLPGMGLPQTPSGVRPLALPAALPSLPGQGSNNLAFPSPPGGQLPSLVPASPRGVSSLPQATTLQLPNIPSSPSRLGGSPLGALPLPNVQ